MVLGMLVFIHSKIIMVVIESRGRCGLGRGSSLPARRHGDEQDGQTRERKVSHAMLSQA
jgi:hypothetical protein